MMMAVGTVSVRTWSRWRKAVIPHWIRARYGDVVAACLWKDVSCDKFCRSVVTYEFRKRFPKSCGSMVTYEAPWGTLKPGLTRWHRRRWPPVRGIAGLQSAGWFASSCWLPYVGVSFDLESNPYWIKLSS
jgi:hypothetical protein